MSFLVPAAFGFALLAVPILILYLLKLRRREARVSSTLLWERLLRDRQANAPWQRLKRSLLLLLQLAILAALVLALARPAQSVPGLSATSVVLVLDASASMNAQDGEEGTTRFEAARRAAEELIETLPGGARVTVIRAGAPPQAIAASESDRAALRRALASVQPGQGPADWTAAFALAAGAANPFGSETVFVLLSDGGLPAEGLPPLPGPLQYLPIGRQADNLAVSALALRAGPEGQAELYARVNNYGDREHLVLLSLYADEVLFHAEQLTLPTGGSQDLALEDLPAGATRYEARLSLPEDGSDIDPARSSLDALPLDDAAFAVFRPPVSGRALLASPGNLFLEGVLASLPGVEPYRLLAEPGSETALPPQGGFNLVILDGMFPPELPTGNLLLINPPPNELVAVTGVFTPTAGVTASGHPLAEFVDWEGVHVRQARQIELPVWAEPVVSAPTGPLVFAGETGGRRVGVIAFDLHDSDLPLQVAFPILFSNLTRYLLAGEGAPEMLEETALQPGESLTLPPSSSGEAGANLAIQSPSGQVYDIPAGQGEAAFAETREVGFYRVDYGAGVEPAFFAVNLFSPLESDLHPAQAVQVGQRSIQPAVAGTLGRRELWPPLAIAALGILLIEWWVYHGRTGDLSPVGRSLRPRRPLFGGDKSSTRTK